MDLYLDFTKLGICSHFFPTSQIFFFIIQGCSRNLGLLYRKWLNKNTKPMIAWWNMMHYAAMQNRKWSNIRKILFALSQGTYWIFFSLCPLPSNPIQNYPFPSPPITLTPIFLSFLWGLDSRPIVFHQSLLIVRHLRWFMALSPELVSCLISHSLHRQKPGKDRNQ